MTNGPVKINVSDTLPSPLLPVGTFFYFTVNVEAVHRSTEGLFIFTFVMFLCIYMFCSTSSVSKKHSCLVMDGDVIRDSLNGLF